MFYSAQGNYLKKSTVENFSDSSSDKCNLDVTPLEKTLEQLKNKPNKNKTDDNTILQLTAITQKLKGADCGQAVNMLGFMVNMMAVNDIAMRNLMSKIDEISKMSNVNDIKKAINEINQDYYYSQFR